MSGYKAYQGKQIEGAGPLGLVLLSYDALYKSLGRAKLCIEAGEAGQEADHTARALEAIIELSSSLNFEQGEDIAVNLSNLYKYMMDKLASGMCSGKTEHIVEVMGLVETLHAGWQQLNMEQKAKSQHNFKASGAVVSAAQTATPLLGYAA
ncbi:MAG: flagellar export chaperone FliS [Ghiorsea sp.]|nr:flagellar export chaperone FliS [Ghiorsea sp.]